MVSTLGMTNSCKCPPALTDSDSRYYSCPDETSRSGFQRPGCFLCAGAGVAPGAARSVGRRPPARAELSAEGGGLKSKRLRPPAAHGRFLTTPTALFSKAHGLPGG